jgi:hypothetical protein
VLAAMENEGIRVDPDTLRRLSNEFSMRMAQFEAKAQELVGRPFNLGSPKQIGDVLFGEMALKGGKKTATGQWSTDSDVLESPGQRARAAARAAGLAPAVEAEGHLYREPDRGDRAGQRPTASTPPTPWPRPRRAACRRRTPTCRTSRSAPRKAARSARPSWPRRARC